MHILALISLAFTASTASAQHVSGVCNQFEILKSHETHCSLYYHCMPDRSAIVRTCPEGLLFDDVAKICNYPRLAKCLNKQCGVAYNGPWADVCCDRYVQCFGNELVISKCSVGTVFNSQSGQCVADYPCQENAMCYRLNAVPTAEPACTRGPVANDPCKFQEWDDQGNDLGIKDCAQGSAFNATLCNCGTLNPNCMKATIVAINNRVIDPQCRATMVLDFSSMPPVTYTHKTTTGQRLMNNYSVGARGYTPANNEGLFNTDSDGHKAHLYFWSFLHNMLVGPFGIKVSFIVDNPQEGYSFIVIGNEIADCSGTLNIRATYQNRQWVIEFKVIAVNTANGQKSTIRETQSVPATNGYVTVIFTMSRSSRIMSGFIKTQGSTSVAWGPVNIGGDQIDINNCPLTVADGLEGRLNEVQFFEACGNLDIIQ